ncbi:glycoside hydrolase family 97 C-terminal domain-containing protein, partial [Arachidicoccus sp.]|uniref:glycoside hydrolase family 97 C-terminal domain-containing protein n=1 Tax=Arachidicoccus sp. TaxID=1872624 RepID=UPI003D1FC94A
GYPGKLEVIARRSGNSWYVAGLNGENIPKELSLDLSFLKNKKGFLIMSGANAKDNPSFSQKNIVVPENGKLNIKVNGNDGFVAVFN